jgi:hypothetical protein
MAIRVGAAAKPIMIHSSSNHFLQYKRQPFLITATTAAFGLEHLFSSICFQAAVMAAKRSADDAILEPEPIEQQAVVEEASLAEIIAKQPVTPDASTVPNQYPSTASTATSAASAAMQQRIISVELRGGHKFDELWITGPVDGIPNKNNTTTDNYNYNNNGLTKHVRGLRMYQ